MKAVAYLLVWSEPAPSRHPAQEGQRESSLKQINKNQLKTKFIVLLLLISIGIYYIYIVVKRHAEKIFSSTM